MSRENVEIVRRSLDAYSRRDLDAYRSLHDPDLEFDWSASLGPEAGVYRGIDAVMRLHASYFETFVEIVIEPECFIEAGESVLVPTAVVPRAATASRSTPETSPSCSPSATAELLTSASTTTEARPSKPWGWEE